MPSDQIFLLLSLPELRASDGPITVRESAGRSRTAPDEATLLAIANGSHRDASEPMVAAVLDPALVRADGSVERAAITEIRYARRDVTGAYVGLDRRSPLVDALDLLPHPEGGWFRETWRSAHSFTPSGYPGARAAGTGIYYVLGPGERSVWHRVRSDELWLWHTGLPLRLTLGGNGSRPDDFRDHVLGGDVLAGQRPQVLVPAGWWQSAEPLPGTADEVLVSCVVSPGFDFADFESPKSAG
ncbi:cupin domain-containing protein [Nocardia sp. NPDC005978]|uniref:cupin domain-containing protein n=1 Tax=Nocardia sp. NPDC005978 TaxID=3156725 RepID=UPI0033A984EA